VEWLITNSIVALILPPASLLVLAGAGALLALRHPRFGRSVIVASLAALWILSTPYVSDALVRSLEPAPGDPLADPSGQAIVVLGGGTYFAAPEYQGRDTVSSYGLTRLRYAAHLHRALKKPILVTGGAPLGNSTSEAEQMKQALEREFQVPVKWTEARANNTLENARLSNGLLRSAKINRIYLVTHAWHMPRARLAFERAGFEVIPAPTEYQTDFKLTVIHFIPGSVALADSSRYFHELIGLGWYHFRLMMGI
jgi:uncharacterized SAM-binding protein YcdF (DUF218 family)